jgi:hypothetical protein
MGDELISNFEYDIGGLGFVEMINREESSIEILIAETY